MLSPPGARLEAAGIVVACVQVMLSPPGARLETLLEQRSSPPGWASPWRASRLPLTEALKGE